MKSKKKTRKTPTAKSKKTSPRPARTPRAKVAEQRTKADEQFSISETLKEAGQPLLFDQLALRVGATTSPQRRSMHAQLKELLHAGDIVLNRRDEYCLRERLTLIVGTVSGHRDGHGFVHPEDRSTPILLSHRQMREVMHGDRVAVRLSGTDHRGRPEGTVVEVLERGTTEIVGRLYDESGISFVVPDNPRIGHRVLVPRDRLGGAKPGQVVLLKLLEQPSKTAQPLGYVARVLGEHAAPGMETEIAIHSHGLPFEFPPDAVAEAEAFGNSVSAAAKRGREDLRDVPLVTIDGEDARDFDDAVWCEPVRGGWRLIVAIADVASYVSPGSALDQEGQHRGTSVYFPNRVLPMLPEALSNGLCSLNPNVDRLCMCCEMRVNEEGKVTRARFFEGLMNSKARLTYTKVAAYLANPAASADPDVTRCGEQLRHLHDVFRALYSARLRRGALDFDAPELKVRFDAEGRIAAFVEQPRNDAHRLIEECMIAANVEAARFLRKHKIPTLYRVHGQPDEDRLEQLRQFLSGFGIELPRDRDLEPQDMNAVLQKIVGNEEAHLIQTVVIRSMPQAAYQPENVGHFGLALAEYAHFTSPIRRYPDLLVHRGIRHVLRGGTATNFEYSGSRMVELGQQTSFTERRADEATRDAMSWLKCEYMQDKIGEEFDALVTGVVDFGLFVQAKGLQIDGLVHVSALGSDYFSRDRTGYRLVGARSGRVFRLGDHLRVRLINVIIDERKIDFELAEARQGPPVIRGPWQRRRGRR
ncbi:ribonuclease R [Povalibacter uvarum]|uniref:Ribonuclease R n=1 Tax=Povalibacter uvarum TaxID=732238 RepID=A0A841HGP1_9GAMM|nr:ribonuclease R [Povalibacter uvarum]MBB6091468.1 ribonuclease R [Povalibacter uvarum]